MFRRFFFSKLSFALNRSELSPGIRSAGAFSLFVSKIRLLAFFRQLPRIHSGPLNGLSKLHHSMDRHLGSVLIKSIGVVITGKAAH